MDNKEQMKKAIREAFKRDKKVTYLFEELKDATSIPLHEVGGGYDWEYESLEEELADVPTESSDKNKVFNIGDIIMTTSYDSTTGGRQSGNPHRVLVSVVDSSQQEDGTIVYKGFLLSSKVDEKSNKKGRRPYPNNIYISNYSTILDKGASSSKEAFIRVDDLVTFTNKDLSDRGSWKGRASREFIDFVKMCYNNYRTGKDNSKVYWER